MNIKIISDSACDLPINIIEEYGIDILPLSVIEGSNQFRDNVDIMPEDLFRLMRQGTMFKTSQVTTNDYMKSFETYIRNKMPFIYISFSSKLSGCFQASVLALQQLKERYGEDIPGYVYDTQGASLGFGLVVLKAAQMAIEGDSLEDIINTIQYQSTHMEHIFTVFDLDYLHKGGRLKKSAAVVGNFLNLYPILDVVDGNLHLVETVRGKKKHFKRIMELIEERGTDLQDQRVGIVHGDNVEVVDEIKNAFRERFNTKAFLVRSVGSVIGAHTGPDMFSIFFLNKNKGLPN